MSRVKPDKVGKFKWTGGVIIVLLFGVFMAGTVQYYRWREGLLDMPFHQDVPLGKFSLGGLHFGACLTDIDSGLAYYCDGFPVAPSGWGSAPNPKSSKV